MNKISPPIQSERIDDLPVIIHWLQQMKVASMIDDNLDKPHGNRTGLSYGEKRSIITDLYCQRGRS